MLFRCLVGLVLQLATAKSIRLYSVQRPFLALSLGLPPQAASGVALHARPGRVMPYLCVDDLPALAGDTYNHVGPANWHWMSMSEDVEFLPLHDRPTKGLERKLEEVAYKTETLSGAYMSYGLFSNQSCVEGMLECNEYQQVWRLLGFLIDCNKVLCKMIKETE